MFRFDQSLEHQTCPVLCVSTHQTVPSWLHSVQTIHLSGHLNICVSMRGENDVKDRKKREK